MQKIESGLFSICHSMFLGWARNDSRPEHRLRVELWIDGIKVSSDTAQRTRSELLLIGSEYIGYAFALYIPYKYRDGNSHTYNIHVADINYKLETGKLVFRGMNYIYAPANRESVFTSGPEIDNGDGSSVRLRKMLVDSSSLGFGVFFTICAKNYLAHAKVLYESFLKYYPDEFFFVVLCDKLDGFVDPNEELLEFIFLEDLNIPNFVEMSERYNITELNTSIKPYVFEYLFRIHRVEKVIYLDPDILIVDRMIELEEMMDCGAEAVLTPHLLSPSEHHEVHDGSMLLFGIYNLGFLALRNTPAVQVFIAWWGRRLVHQCTIDISNGIFVDQKWADLLPAYVPGTRILHHPGYNVAYWNLTQRKIQRSNGIWYSNNLPLRFVHFSGNSILDGDTFSRHNQEVTVESIGDLRYLLEEYREGVMAQGYSKYSKYPYAYSWNGSSGVNLHTPSSLDASKGSVTDQDAGQSIEFSQQIWFKRSGTEVLYLDWGIPRPDRDAASVTAKMLLKIFVDLGCNVSFLPCNLIRIDGYYEDIVAMGIDVLCKPVVNCVQTWLSDNAHRFDLCVLSRGPVVWPYLELLLRCAPQARRIFNTVDLHYLRELRKAELENDAAGLNRAMETRDREYELIEKCDATVLLSRDELYAIRESMPSAQVTVLPLVFSDIPGALNKYQNRKDMLFIGGFPHLPNIDAVMYFATEVFPLIQRRLPQVKFKVIGDSPPDEIRDLARNPGIEILGYVNDIGRIFEQIKITVAPLRYGAGIKGKIGTSFCYGVPCVATDLAIEGMGLLHNRNILVGNTAEEFADAVWEVYTNEDCWNKLSVDGHRFAMEHYSEAMIAGQVKDLLHSVLGGWKMVESLYELDDWASWKKHAMKMENEFKWREDREQRLLPVPDAESFETAGFCCVCGCASVFLTSYMYSTGRAPNGRVMPNWREHLQCGRCGLTNRVRAALNVLHTMAVPDEESRIYLTERVTSTYSWIAAKYMNVQGSEYFGPNIEGGKYIGDVRHEDIQSMSFSDSSFDRVLSFDVLEHVPNPIEALSEIFRVLANSGTFIFSVPFASNNYEHIIRARLLANGDVYHNMEPEYHGNPINAEEGSLCFQYFGWKILDDLRDIGFVNTRALAYWSEVQGYMGKEQYIFIARKAQV